MSYKLQWITWWPAPYWEPRFEILNSMDDVELNVYYAQKKSTIHKWPETYNRKYSYEFIDTKNKHKIGYKFNISDLYCVFKVFKVFKNRCDIIILPYADIRFIVIMLLCILKNEKYFIFCANTIYDERNENIFKEFIKKFFFSNASAILATGEAQKDYATRYVKHRNNIKIVGNPSVGLGKTTTINSNSDLAIFPVSDKKIILLYVGRLSREKGLYDLLYAVSLLNHLVIKFKLLIVGDGPDKEILIKLSHILQIDCVFTGFIKQLDHLNCIYEIADIFILPSHSEPWGLVVNEAMQNKLPVILSDKIGCKKMLLKEGDNGYSFRSGDAHDLSNKIQLLINPLIRERMGHESYKIIRNQNPKLWSQNVLKAIYDTI